jgi:AAHS family 4-hydroxybenzoate transporter-like MFS transporter
MMADREIDILAVIERQKLRGFQLMLGALVFAVMAADGYDAQNIGFAAGALIKAWHIPKAALGPIFGAGLAGLMAGAAIFGPLGDRFGRKRMIIASALFVGVMNLATTQVTTPGELFWFRLLAGLGVGGVLPNAIALISEYSPRRVQATAVWVVMVGYSLGAAGGALVATWLVPAHGWPVMFVVGGVLPIGVALLGMVFLAESVRFLALRPDRRDTTAALLRRIEPGLRIDSSSRLMLNEIRPRGLGVRQLFTDGRAPMTLLLWLAFICNLMTLHFLVSWTPTVLQSTEFSQAQAAIATSMIQFGGITGGLIVSRLLDTRGLAANALLFAFGAPIVALVGIGHRSGDLAMLLTFGAGFCIVGGQTVLNAVSGRIYPTAMRANGVGWANAVGRFGSVAGPVVGGVLISLDLPVEELFNFAAIPVVCAAIACFLVSRLQARLAPEGTGELVVEAGE